MRHRLLCTLLLTLAATAALAAPRLEVYTLGFRQAEQLVPLIEPHLGDGASISASGKHLLVRAEPEAHRTVRQLLSEFDKAPANLMISLRTDASGESRASGGGFSGRVGSGGVSGGISIYGSEAARSKDATQSVRGLEGYPARFSETLWLPIRDEAVWSGNRSSGISTRTRFLTLEDGFYVIARLAGDRVELEIAAASAEGLEQRQTVTRVSGALGEWIPLSGADETGAAEREGLVARSESARESRHQAWIKVERVP